MVQDAPDLLVRVTPERDQCDPFQLLARAVATVHVETSATLPPAWLDRAP
jgi:hypothetical protein